MVEPKVEPQPNPLEVAVDEAIAVCDGDVRAALLAALVYNEFLERKLDMMRGMVSTGYSRGKISPARRASEKVDEWRETSKEESTPKDGQRAGCAISRPCARSDSRRASSKMGLSLACLGPALTYRTRG
jgi:hypothetical protein